jgi:hypothetical protein
MQPQIQTIALNRVTTRQMRRVGHPSTTQITLLISTAAGWAHLGIPPSPVLDMETSRAEKLRHNINSHKGTMNECTDPGPSIENEQYVAPFWILRSENVRCKGCAREIIAGYINNRNLWTFILEYKVEGMNKNTSISDGEHSFAEPTAFISDEAAA